MTTVESTDAPRTIEEIRLDVQKDMQEAVKLLREFKLINDYGIWQHRKSN